MQTIQINTPMIRLRNLSARRRFDTWLKRWQNWAGLTFKSPIGVMATQLLKSIMLKVLEG